MYGYQCECCTGIVKSRLVKREAFKNKSGFVILENITIGVCDKCGNRYYTADMIHAVNDIATSKIIVEKTEKIPVDNLG
jgi:YgiT-type zinc finger domain-containing protein